MCELSLIAGVSLSQIYRIRQGKRQISGNFVARVLSALPDFKFEDLFYIEKEAKNE